MAGATAAIARAPVTAFCRAQAGARWRAGKNLGRRSAQGADDARGGRLQTHEGGRRAGCRDGSTRAGATIGRACASGANDSGNTIASATWGDAAADVTEERAATAAQDPGTTIANATRCNGAAWAVGDQAHATASNDSGNACTITIERCTSRARQRIGRNGRSGRKPGATGAGQWAARRGDHHFADTAGRARRQAWVNTRRSRYPAAPERPAVATRP